jgi:ATP-dependent Lon protease
MANNNKKGNKRNFKDNLNYDNNDLKNDISHKNKIKIVNKKQIIDKKILSDTSDEEPINKNSENNFESMLSTLIKDFDPTKNTWGSDQNKNMWSSEPIIVKAPFDLFFPKSNLTTEKEGNKEKDFKKTEIDLACLAGDIKKLNDWLSKNISSDTFDLKHTDDYTSESLDGASVNNRMDVLSWWLENNRKYALPLKYTEKSINEASRLGLINILNWWYDSKLLLKYNENAINNASIKNKINVLDWWFNKIKEKRVEFKYSQAAFDKCKLEEKDMLELLKWWKNNFDKHNMVFLYGKEFIDFIVSNNYDDVIKYLLENKLLTDDDVKKNKPSKRLGLNNLFEMFSNPKKEHSSKFDTSTLPKDIQDHIKEKEEELNNNMLINGKAKEYIDNLVKIPFGKYREEKIFKFIIDLNKTLNNKYKLELKNESDLIEYFKTNQNINYYTLYQQFCEYRIKYLEYVDKTLDKCVYGHTQTKKQIKCILAQWLSGGIKKGVVLGIQGPPGVGKTTIIKGALALCIVDFIDYNLDEDKPKDDKTKENNLWIKIAEESCNVKRPFCFISLGGSTNSSTLIGHNITYHGATSGDIVKSLKEAKYMNPILYFDELDKISKTEHGNEISSVLTHITDPAQNEHFTDRYFSEVKIDLSKCIIIFSYNDQTKIDRILYDRIQEIKLQAIPLQEKVEICKNFLIPEILDNMGYNKDNIVLSNNELENIILGYTYEAGVRKIKEKLNEILRNYHLNRLTKNQSITNEILTNDYVDTALNDHHKILLKKITPKPAIGCIHGMYATTNGLGDVMLIQVKKMYNKDLLGLHTTGSLEKVITESIQVARTVAWNLLTDDERKTIETTFVNTGLHVHCPDGSTPKDGPSAGTAITTAIYSLLTGKLIKNDIAITGEIDLDGNVTAIGGLDAKLSGAKRAGIKLALVPTENKRDVEILLKKNTTLVDSKFKVKFISHVNEVLKIVFKN